MKKLHSYFYLYFCIYSIPSSFSWMWSFMENRLWLGFLHFESQSGIFRVQILSALCIRSSLTWHCSEGNFNTLHTGKRPCILWLLPACQVSGLSISVPLTVSQHPSFPPFFEPSRLLWHWRPSHLQFCFLEHSRLCSISFSSSKSNPFAFSLDSTS